MAQRERENDAERSRILSLVAALEHSLRTEQSAREAERQTVSRKAQTIESEMVTSGVCTFFPAMHA